MVEPREGMRVYIEGRDEQERPRLLYGTVVKRTATEHTYGVRFDPDNGGGTYWYSGADWATVKEAAPEPDDIPAVINYLLSANETPATQ